MTSVQTLCTTIATTGTFVFGDKYATLRKKSPSSAIAKYTRGPVSTDWLRNPTVETAIPSAISLAPVSPATIRITALAGTLVAARAVTPSARTHIRFTDT